jgi:hypothetical protein
LQGDEFVAQTKPIKDPKAVKAAREYVRQQIATMKAHGAAPRLSADDFKDIVHQVAAATK